MRQSGAKFEEIVVLFHTEERSELIRKHSPTGLVPVLTDRDLLINDSLAIAKYLAERHRTAAYGQRMPQRGRRRRCIPGSAPCGRPRR